MSLSLVEREKLVRTLQTHFPLAKKWEKKHDRRVGRSSFGECVLLTGGALALAATTVGSILLTNFLWSHQSTWMNALGFLGALGSIAVVLALGVCTVLAGVNGFSWLMNVWTKATFNRKSPALREYFKQKAAERYVARCLEHVSWDELNLLMGTPRFNVVFNKVFHAEDERRKQEGLRHHQDTTWAKIQEFMVADPTQECVVEVDTPQNTSESPRSIAL